MRKQIPELNYLLKEVEKHYGRRLATSTDFEALSVIIEHTTNEMISASTLKRLWGYVSKHPVPRITTLDILSRYIGFKDFKTFCNNLKTQADFESSFFSINVIDVSNLTPGNKVEICWNPNRLVTLKYLGEFRFRVISSVNSHLLVDDEFTATSFMQDYPLYIASITRGEESTPSYIAGSNSGLTSIRVLD